MTVEPAPAIESDDAVPALTLVLGGARSGKSRHAEALVAGTGRRRLVYIATAEAGDAEMAARIAAHKARRGDAWETVEAPLDLATAITANSTADSALLVDCLTLWLANLIGAGCDVAGATDDLLDAIAAAPGPIVCVANEVGLGIVPDNALARAFRDAAGHLNQAVAAAADDVYLMTAGLPVTVKQEGPRR